MARQATQDTVDISVDAPVDLTTSIDDLRVADGTRVWVVGAGVSHGLWCLDKSSAAVPDGTTVVATLSGVGRWLLFGAASVPAIPNISVNTEAQLTAFAVVAFLDGAVAWVGNPAGGVGQSQDSTWQLVTQRGGLPALSAHEVIASTVAGRVWQRLLNVATPRWTQQITWYVDPAAGDDQNDGATNVTALQTWAEFARRMPIAATAYTVNVLGNLAATDPISWAPRLEWSRQLSATKPSVTVIGTETVLANGVFAAGASLYAGNNPSQFTVAAHGAWTVGRPVRNTTAGPRLNSLCIVSRDMGAGQAECSPFWLYATSAEAAAPVAGDTFNEVGWSTAPDLRIVGLSATLRNLDFTATTLTRGSGYTFQECRVPGASLLIGSQVTFNGCHVNNGGLSVFSPALIVSLGSFIDRTATVNAMVYNSGGQLSLVSTLIRGNAVGTTAGIQVGGSIGCPGVLVIRKTQYFALGTAATSGVKAVVAGFVDVEDVLGGSGNASLGGAAFEVNGGQVFVKAGVTPTVTGVVELLVDGAANQIPPLVAGGAVPAVAPITTWNQWVNLPFSRFFQGNGTGAILANTP